MGKAELESKLRTIMVWQSTPCQSQKLASAVAFKVDQTARAPGGSLILSRDETSGSTRSPTAGNWNLIPEKSLRASLNRIVMDMEACRRAGALTTSKPRTRISGRLSLDMLV